MDRRAALEIRQAEVHPAVAAVGRSEQGEQGLVLVDGEQLPLAQGPPLWCEAERHYLDLGQKRCTHTVSLPVGLFHYGVGQLAAFVNPPPLPLVVAMPLGVPLPVFWPCRKLTTALVFCDPPV